MESQRFPTILTYQTQYIEHKKKAMVQSHSSSFSLTHVYKQREKRKTHRYLCHLSKLLKNQK